MSNKTPELIRKGIQRELRRGKLSKPAIAEQFKVSIGTVKRIAKEIEGELQELAAKADPVQQLDAAIASVSDGRFNLSTVLEAIITSLQDKMADAPVKSYEGAVGALCKAGELHRRYNPLTLDEGIDLLLAIPGTTPHAIARRLRERLDEMNVS